MATRRARRREEKLERGGGVVGAAERGLSRRPFSAITIAEVAKEAGLAKATIFLYFPTRESLFLLVLEKLLTDFFSELTEGQQAPRLTPPQAGRWIAVLVEKHALMVKLF